MWVRMEVTGWEQEGGRKTVVGGVSSWTGLRNRRESTLGGPALAVSSLMTEGGGRGLPWWSSG